MRAMVMALAVCLGGCSTAGEPEVEVGDEMPSLAWEGYVNESAEGLANEQPFVDYSTGDLRATNKRYVLVHLSESF